MRMSQDKNRLCFLLNFFLRIDSDIKSTRRATTRAMRRAAPVLLLLASLAQPLPSKPFVPPRQKSPAPHLRARRSRWIRRAESPGGVPPASGKPLPTPPLWDVVLAFAGGTPWDAMLGLAYKGYVGPTQVSLPVLGDYIFLNSPESVREVTVTQARSFPRRFSVPLFSQLGLDKGIVYEQGKRHQEHKVVCTPAFENRASIEYFLKAIQNETNSLVDTWRARARSSGQSNSFRLDLYNEARSLTLEVILKVTFGTQNFAKAEELSSIIGEYLEKIVAVANEVPPWWQIGLSANYRRVTETLLPGLRALVLELIAKRREELSEEEDNMVAADLLGVLLSSKVLSDEDILAVLFDVVIAGSDTTASTITAALFLLYQPQQKQLLESILDEVHGADLTTIESINDVRASLPVLSGCIRETLRLYPPVPFIGRTSIEPALVDGCEIPEGSVMCWSPWFLGRNPQQWREPVEEVRPQRWDESDAHWNPAPSTGAARDSFSFLPFGAGPRGCLGSRLGIMEATLAVAGLLKEFSFQFDRDELDVRYDLTLNLEGACVGVITPLSGRREAGG